MITTVIVSPFLHHLSIVDYEETGANPMGKRQGNNLLQD